MTPTHRNHDLTDTDKLRETLDENDRLRHFCDVESRAALAAAPQPAPADREALVEGIAQIIDHPSVYMGGPSRNAMRIADAIVKEYADALLARGLRLPGVVSHESASHDTQAPLPITDDTQAETMAWAVLGEDGKPLPHAWSHRSIAASHAAQMRPVRPVVRVAIRVVEGGDDASDKP